MYNPVILCITWNFSFLASLSTEHGIEYYPRKGLVYRMNSCCTAKALSQASSYVSSISWSCRNESIRLEVEKVPWYPYPLLSNFWVVTQGLVLLLLWEGSWLEEAFRRYLLLSVSQFSFLTLWWSCSACFLAFLISKVKLNMHCFHYQVT